jgi:uncharacterized membrane protein
VSDQDRNSDLVEVLKRSGTLRKDWGLLFGAFFMNRAINAAVGRRPIWWSGLAALGTVAGGLVLKYGLSTFG